MRSPNKYDLLIWIAIGYDKILQMMLVILKHARRGVCVVQEQVERVFQKQLSMQEMFEKRRISLKKLAAKQTRPVQPVAPRPEAIIKSPLSSPGKAPSTLCGIRVCLD